MEIILTLQLVIFPYITDANICTNMLQRAEGLLEMEAGHTHLCFLRSP
jgi:hypothetical protein